MSANHVLRYSLLVHDARTPHLAKVRLFVQAEENFVVIVRWVPNTVALFDMNERVVFRVLDHTAIGTLASCIAIRQHRL